LLVPRRAAVALLAVLALTGAAGARDDHDHGAPPGAPPFLYEPPAPGTYELPPIRRAPDFAAIDSATGKRIRLADFRGKGVLLTFIYTSCPDAKMCPLAVATIARVRRTLGERGFGDRVRYLTITVDPVRDTPEALRRYAALMHAEGPDWLFLAPETMAAAEPLFAAYDLHPRHAPDGTITHLLRTYLIDPTGVIRQIYLPSYFDSRVVANDLMAVLTGDGPAD
jgi:cytochrome oxidase Cu insertion factor (SCO1/SenC/PrrC family)